MAEEEPKEGQTANAAPDPFVDDELHAAEGIRNNAERIASALGALPGLAIITSLVRAPGEEGFEPWKIVLGVGLAALGAIVGIRAFADVMAPADLKDEDLAQFPMSKLSGNPFTTYPELVADITAVAWANESAVAESIEEEAEAKRLEGLAVAKDATASRAEAAAASAKPPSDDALKAATKARSEASTARSAADEQTARAAGEKVRLRLYDDQLAARRRLRTDAMRLQAASNVRDRSNSAWRNANFAVGCIAAAVIFLALAPKPKAEEPAAAPTIALLSIQLTDAGRLALGCPGLQTVQGIQIGGTDASPKIVTLPVEGCPSRELTFGARTHTEYGDVSKVQALTSNPTPSP